MKTLITLTGPSGVGKSTIVNELISRYGDIFGDAIAFTSRNPREGEEAGRDYVFMNVSQINALQKNGGIAAISHIHGNTYGHTKTSISEACKDGKIGVAISDKRVPQYKEYGEEVGGKVISLLILPPSYVTLGRRVIERERKEQLSRDETRARWTAGYKFISEGRKSRIYDHEIVNHTVEDSIQQILRILKIEV